jgi:hypothetical protein
VTSAVNLDSLSVSSKCFKIDGLIVTVENTDKDRQICKRKLAEDSNPTIRGAQYN